MRICVLDLGATSFHLLHARVAAQGDVTRLDSASRLIRFGEGTIIDGVIGGDAWNRGLRAFGELVRRARALQPDRIVAVATSAVREASNGRAFAAAAEHLHGVAVRVVSAEDEARLSYAGAVSAVRGPVGRAVVIDVGGGSIEIALGDGARCEHTASVTMGVLRLRDAFEIDAAISAIEARALAMMVRMSLEPMARVVREHRPDRVLFASGTARAVHRLGREALPEPPAAGKLTFLEALALRRFVVGTSPHQLEQLGVVPQRADTVAIAAIVIETLLEQMGALAAELPAGGLREGVALHEARAARGWAESRRPHLGRCRPDAAR